MREFDVVWMRKWIINKTRKYLCNVANVWEILSNVVMKTYKQCDILIKKIFMMALYFWEEDVKWWGKRKNSLIWVVAQKYSKFVMKLIIPFLVRIIGSAVDRGRWFLLPFHSFSLPPRTIPLNLRIRRSKVLEIRSPRRPEFLLGYKTISYLFTSPFYELLNSHSNLRLLSV